MGGSVAPLAQKVRTPKRIIEITAIRPETMIRAIRVQPDAEIAAAPDTASTCGLSSAWNMPNLATKPDSGGRPAIISAQAAKASDRKAIAAGTPRPVGSSGASSTANASMVSASIAERGVRMRSISSISSRKAATATVEPIR